MNKKLLKIEDFVNRPLEGLLQPVESTNPKMATYLLCRLLGEDIGESLYIMGNHINTIYYWRKTYPYFKELEIFLMDRQGEFKRQAQEYLNSTLRAGMLLVTDAINTLTITKPKKVCKAERQRLAEACSLIMELEDIGKALKNGRVKQ